ncbi:hypothetical protein MF271_22755 (plasmid) [Deinococcus sp. KNUC1210]|uniref:hypothetical protein n=1 Tax=Deinococcus sp. KNUC1210 TaxID=2917691 RepID=UPI001EEF81A7|nr:hypothetical protein [Deinococcus sp. KNUC1210]ULH18286.1 hypothetical protein MF271_22755 [Deinococcus sp. KNUC1210]
MSGRFATALWYATHPATGQGRLMAVRVTQASPSLDDPAVLHRLCTLSELDATCVRNDPWRAVLT